MRRFYLERVDTNGGGVKFAEGVAFTNGSVAIARSYNVSGCLVYEDVAAAKKVHCEDGTVRWQWIDFL